LAAVAGCTLGMILAYGIGNKLGMPFFEKYGSRLHLVPERLNTTSIWFTKYGNKLLIIALFIQGTVSVGFISLSRNQVRLQQDMYLEEYDWGFQHCFLKFSACS
jgi:hypothetical protein